VQPHHCVCGAMPTVDGHHGLSSRYGCGRQARHNLVNVVLRRAFASTGTLATREPNKLCTSNGKRPDGVTQIPWKRGQYLSKHLRNVTRDSQQRSSRICGSRCGVEENVEVSKHYCRGLFRAFCHRNYWSPGQRGS